MLVFVCWRVLRILAFSEADVGMDVDVDAFTLICSYACWNVLAIFPIVTRSVMILLAFIFKMTSCISCSCSGTSAVQLP
jgi:hypothetical protein